MGKSYWLSYDYYSLPAGCSSDAPAISNVVGLNQCLARCSRDDKCQGASYHAERRQCQVHSKCEGEPGRCAPASWCGYIRATMLTGKALRRGSRFKVELRDAPQPLPRIPIGHNANTSAVRALCPNGEFISCLGADIKRKYPVHALFVPKKLPWREPLQNARRVFGGLGRNCTTVPPRSAAAASADKDARSFVASALEPEHDLHAQVGSGGPAPLPAAQREELRKVAAAAAATAAQSQPRLRCASSSSALNANLLLLVGVPSCTSPSCATRRDAARTSWMGDAQVGRSVGVCFLLSAYSYAATLAQDGSSGLGAEAAREADLLFLQVAETPQLITARTPYSNRTRRGRGMPTFKQFAFFRHAATMLPGVAFVGKIDDDTAVNLRLLGPLLREAHCLEWALFGSIQWSGFIPSHAATGVRGDRCGFGWDWLGALREYGQPGPQLSKMLPRAGCVAFGAVPPFPYAAGAGYIFSAALLRWVGLSPLVGGWVLEALGPTRDAVQWQKYEDTSTGYWLTHAPQPVEYVNIGYWHHDLQCMLRGEEFSGRGGIYRPPANYSILVHNLKKGGFHYAYARMQRHIPYDDDACRSDTFARASARGKKRRKRQRQQQRGLGGASRMRRRAAGPVAADSR